MISYLAINSGRPIGKLEGEKKYVGIKTVEPDHPDASERKKRPLLSVDDILEDLDSDEEDELMSILKKLSGRQDTHTKLLEFKTKLSYIPNTEMREVLYIAGPSGSGKSYFAASYATKYAKLFEKPIYLFSTKDEDKQLDIIRGLTRVPINEDFIEADIDYNMFKNSLCIFDDVDSLASKKQLANAVWGLRDTLLQNGRSNNTYVISTVHNAFGYRTTITSLQEAHLVVFFLNNGSDAHFKKYLKERAGLDKDMIRWIMNLRSRWVCFYTHAPRFIIWEYGVRAL